MLLVSSQRVTAGRAIGLSHRSPERVACLVETSIRKVTIQRAADKSVAIDFTPNQINTRDDGAE